MAVYSSETSKVYLEPIEHVYIHRETGQKFTSVTKVISSIEEHFDSEGVAMAIVRQSDDRKQEKYIGMSQKEILIEWQRINDEANVYGTRVHELIETYLFKNKFFFPTDPFEIAVIKAYNELNVDEGREIYPERIMFTQEYELAGTADLMIDIDDTYFDIGDWKTNKEFNYHSKYGKTLLKPFDHLQDCQYSVYSLQLSVYALMYEMETGKKCRKIWVGYWNKETLKLSYIPIMYLKTEAQKLLDLHKYKVKLEKK
jgi:hypothetical protein